MPTMTLYPVGDTYIDKSNPNTNYGSSTELRIGVGVDRFASFLQFDLLSSGIVCKKVLSAEFGVWLTLFNVADPNNILSSLDWSVNAVYYSTSSLIETILTYVNYSNLGTIDFKSQGDDGDKHTYYPLARDYQRFNYSSSLRKYKNSKYYTLYYYNKKGQSGITLGSKESENKPYLAITYEDLPSLPPTALSPASNELKNPKSTIALSWQFVKNPYNGDYDQPAPLEDPQISSTVRYRVNSGAWTEIKINNGLNTYTFPTNHFGATSTGTVEWQVKTATKYNGEGTYSATASFKLGATPPQKPIPIYPVNLVVNGDITFEWQYLSNYDTEPTRYDLLYKIDSGVWRSVSAQTSDCFHKIPGLDSSSTVQWQVRTYGKFSESGEYCDIVTFSTAGKPKNPTIISVTNSARPVISWAAEDLQTWEIIIVKNAAAIYETGLQPYNGEFYHKLKGFLDDGQYVVRLRVKNEFGFYSNWIERAFNVITNKPPVPSFSVVHNPEYAVKLNFSKTAAYTLIYRSEIAKDDFMCTGKTSGLSFDDYTAEPYRKYKYFIRSVKADDSYSDSEVRTGYVAFDETVLASIDDLSKMVRLKESLNDDPTKEISLSNSVKFFNFINRRYPVAEPEEFREDIRRYSFFIDDYKRLENYVFSPVPLLIRDKQLGVVYGFINGKYNAKSTKFKGYLISFDFVRIDCNGEVDIDA